MNKTEMKEFINDSISSGKVVENENIELTQSVILEIENILNTYNDTTARTKIRKILILYGKSN